MCLSRRLSATKDLPAEFYLDTVIKVLQQHALPLSRLMVFSCQAK
ncbi:hypothetical protein LJR296_007129 [Cupriavidus necator]